MKNSTGFSIRVDQHQQTIAAVQRQDPETWTVTDLSTAREGTQPPQNLVLPMARRPQAVTWLLPNDLARAEILSLPQLKGKELTRAVTGSIARQEKGEPHEYAVSWQALPRGKSASDDPRQLVFALHAEQKEVDAQLVGGLARSVAPARMLPSFMILDQFYRLTHDTAEVQGAWNLVFLGQQENFQVISREGSPMLTRGLPFDLSDGTESEQYVDQLATEVDRSGFFIRQGQSSASIEKTIVTGDTFLARRLVEVLKERSETPAETWDIGAHFTWGARDVPAEAFVPLMAAALSLEKDRYNLLPPVKRQIFGPRFKRRALVAAGTAGVALLPVLLIGSTVTAKVQEAYLLKARQRLETARIEAQEAAEIYKQQRLLLSRRNYIESFHRQRPDLEAALLKIGALAPGEVYFRDLRVAEDEVGKTRVTLTGYSEAASSSRAQAAFNEFKQRLENTPFLRSYTEPIQLEIDGETGGHISLPRTVFQLRFQLVSDRNPESGNS